MILSSGFVAGFVLRFVWVLFGIFYFGLRFRSWGLDRICFNDGFGLILGLTEG